MDIFLSGKTEQNTRKIYLQCEKSLNDEQESVVNNHFFNSVVVHCNGFTYAIQGKLTTYT